MNEKFAIGTPVNITFDHGETKPGRVTGYIYHNDITHYTVEWEGLPGNGKTTVFEHQLKAT